LVCELEATFATQFQVAGAQVTTVANATLGLELVLQALDLPAGSRILLPSFTLWRRPLPCCVQAMSLCWPMWCGQPDADP
jgi:hypothetical protein